MTVAKQALGCVGPWDPATSGIVLAIHEDVNQAIGYGHGPAMLTTESGPPPFDPPKTAMWAWKLLSDALISLNSRRTVYPMMIAL
jgi:hypothetical protein